MTPEDHRNLERQMQEQERANRIQREKEFIRRSIVSVLIVALCCLVAFLLVFVLTSRGCGNRVPEAVLAQSSNRSVEQALGEIRLQLSRFSAEHQAMLQRMADIQHAQDLASTGSGKEADTLAASRERIAVMERSLQGMLDTNRLQEQNRHEWERVISSSVLGILLAGAGAFIRALIQSPKRRQAMREALAFSTQPLRDAMDTNTEQLKTIVSKVEAVEQTATATRQKVEGLELMKLDLTPVLPKLPDPKWIQQNYNFPKSSEGGC
jgi:hypothetical protein